MKSIKKVLLFTHEKYHKNEDISKLTRFLKSKKIGTELLIQTSKNIEIQSSSEIIDIRKIKKQTSLSGFGMVIVFGGDGLFLSASKIAYLLNIPILGINFGKIGFLVDLDKKDIIKKVYEILKGSYITDKRIMIDGKVTDDNQKVISSTSLNDIVIYNHGLLKMIQAKIFINDFLINIQRSDGVIVSTPTGSTAYSMSNGCPIVSPTADVINITPISPHTYSDRPIIIDSSDIIKSYDGINGNNQVFLTKFQPTILPSVASATKLNLLSQPPESHSLEISTVVAPSVASPILVRIELIPLPGTTTR